MLVELVFLRDDVVLANQLLPKSCVLSSHLLAELYLLSAVLVV